MDLTRTQRSPGPVVEYPGPGNLREYLSLVHDKDDGLVRRLERQAVGALERHLGITLLASTWRLRLPRFPLENDDGRDADEDLGGVFGRRHAAIVLPRPPLIEVLELTYRDEAGAGATLAADAGYQLEIRDGFGELTPPINGAWPATQVGNRRAVEVTYRAGYADGEVPEELKLAVMAYVRHVYDHPVEPGLPESVRLLLQDFETGDDL